MGISTRGLDYTPGTIHACRRSFSPRVRNALWLYESSVAKTKGEAADMAGLARGTFYQRTSQANLALVQKHSLAHQAHIMTQVLDIQQRIKSLSHKAIEKIGDLIDHPDPNLALQAARDMADRNPETAKSSKVEITPSLDPDDIKALAVGLVEAARLRQAHADLGTSNLIRMPGVVE